MSDPVAQEPPPPPPGAVLLRIVTGHHASRALHVAAQLGLADHLAGGARGAEDLAAATGTHAPSLRRLPHAMAAFGVFREEPDGRFALAPPGEALRADAPDSARPLVLLWGHAEFRRTWDALEHCVRTGETAARHLFGGDDAFARCAADAELGAAFNAGMTAFTALFTPAIVAACDLAGARHVVDVGGGEGRLLAALLRAHSAARGTLFDLPSVVAGAGAVLAAAGVAERVTLAGGDVFAEVPASGDVYVLKSVLHDWDDARAAAILAACACAMAAAGGGDARLLVVERVLAERTTTTPAAQAAALSALNMLVRTGGRERTEAEFAALLRGAGLRLVRARPAALPFTVLEAVPA